MIALLAAAPLLFQEAAPRWADHPEADALEYRIHLELDPAAKRLSGRVDYLFRAEEELEQLRFDSVAGENWSVRFTGAAGAQLAAERQGDELWVRLPEKAAKGAEVRLSAFLEGTPPDGLYFFDTRYGEPCAFTDHFTIRARGWLPCEDSPADRARFTLSIKVPEGYRAVCTGAGGWVAGEERLWRAECGEELPTYLLALAVAPFEEIVEEGDPRLAPHRVYAKDAAKARATLKDHTAWMQAMEAAVGPYPYAKYCVVQVPTRWGGMENAGNTFLMERIFDGRRGGSGILAHEFAHQWFGDGVGYADWKDVWLSEGFASWFGPWLDARTGGPELSAAMARSRSRWLASREGRTLPILWDGYEQPDQILNQNAYPKGAWVLHMLRAEIGEEAFFAGLRRYYRENRGRSVRTAALRAALEAESERELGWFFEQWLARPGCPELRFTWGAESVKVEQVQEGEAFRFPLQLQWNDAEGTTRTASYRIHARESELPLPGGLGGAPLVDPGVELLFRRAN